MAPLTRPLQVLIVDAHERDREQLLQILRQGFPGAIVQEIADEIGLTEAVRRTSFDVVITEYRLGWSDGLAVLRTVKTSQPQAVVIWASRAPLDEAIVLGVKAGLSDYVSKRRLHHLVDVIKASLDDHADVHAQPTTFQTLQTSEQRLRAIAALTSDYAYVLRIEAPGRITVEWVDERHTAFTGYTLAQLEESGGWTHLLHPQDAPSAIQRRQRWLTGQPDISEFRILTPSGEERWVREYTCPAYVSGTTGDLLIYGAGQDITHRRLLEAPLRQAQQMEAFAHLAGGIAHDFNNVLQVVSGYGDMVLRRMTRRSPLRHYVQEIRNVADQGAMLTRQLMTLSRKPYPQLQMVEIEKTFDKIAPMLRRLLGGNVELHLVVPSALGQVQTDPEQLEQVIMTLAVNARDAMTQGGCLTVEVAKINLPSSSTATQVGAPPGSYLQLTVRDTGPVLDMGIPSSIFEPFSIRGRGGKGADLGLFTVYSIVNQTGGTMRIESTPGIGTSITVYWPCANLSDVTVDAGVVTSATARAGGETILLVEDEALVRDLVRRVLLTSGYTVLEAVDGEQALQLRHEHPGPIDLLVADVMLPGLSGPEVAKRLVAMQPGLPVLYMSGYARETVERYDLPLSTSAFLQKPFTPAALLDRVREALKDPSTGALPSY